MWKIHENPRFSPRKMIINDPTIHNYPVFVLGFGQVLGTGGKFWNIALLNGCSTYRAMACKLLDYPRAIGGALPVKVDL